MSRVKCVVSYDGSNFFGFQKQPNKRTIQGEIESALFMIYKKNIIIHGSGRTDAKVHAYNQVFHFDVDIMIDIDKFVFAINGYLPEDIYVKSASYVDETFHSRFSHKQKTYLYKMKFGNRDPLRTKYCLYLKPMYDINRMKEAIKYFEGSHDFCGFGTKVDKENTIRTIYEARIESGENGIYIYFTGNGFLRYQVRRMVGTLLDVGRNKLSPNDIKKILEQKSKGGKKISPVGLYLYDVTY